MSRRKTKRRLEKWPKPQLIRTKMTRKADLGGEDHRRVGDEALRERVEGPGVDDPVEREREEERPAVEVPVHEVQEPGEKLAARAEEEAEDGGGLEAGRGEALPECDRGEGGAADGEAEEAHRGRVGHDFLAVERDGGELDHSYLRPAMVACGGRLVKRRVFVGAGPEREGSTAGPACGGPGRLGDQGAFVDISTNDPSPVPFPGTLPSLTTA